MFVARVEADKGEILICVPTDLWDLEGIGLVQIAVNEGFAVNVVHDDDDTINVRVELDGRTAEQLSDLGIYLVEQATE